MTVLVVTTLFGASLAMLGPVHNAWRWTRAMGNAIRKHP
jgi:hypothetical protein